MDLDPRRIVVTGGAGFIGSALIRYLVGILEVEVLNIDKLTYAGNLESLQPVTASDRYHFERADVCDGPQVQAILHDFRPDAIMHLAAESHVDRSIDHPAEFVQTNVLGTSTLLAAAEGYWAGLPATDKETFRYLQVSTDEVFGSLGSAGCFDESTCYRPNSPYAASKASADHLARAWFRTFGLPIIVTNCSNNYGPYQFPEKLIPLMILRAISGQTMPVYGKGDNVRDWLYVDDHARGLWRALCAGQPGRTYLFGGRSERSNIDIVRRICGLLDQRFPGSPHCPHRSLIDFVEDRPGHDFRYAVDAGRANRELDWRPAESLDSGLEKTVDWYLENADWCANVQDGSYRGQRLGLRA